VVRTRLKILAVLLALPFTALGFSLWQIQVRPTAREELVQQGRLQHISTIALPPRRGRILDRHGEVLAESSTRYDLVFVPEDLDPNPVKPLLERIALELEAASPGTGLSVSVLETHLLARCRSERAFALARGEPETRSIPFIEDVPDAAAREIEMALAGHPAFRVSRSLGRARIDASPDRVLELEAVLEDLSRVLPGSTRQELLDRVAQRYEEIETHLSRRHGSVETAKKLNEREMLRGRPVRLVSGVDLDTVTAIEYEPNRYPGIGVIDDATRRYPQGEIGGAIVGYLRRPGPADLERFEAAGRILETQKIGELADFSEKRDGVIDRDDLIGATGLEASQDTRLRGKYGARRLRKDSRGRPVGEDVERLSPEEGADIRTTLDTRLSRVAFDALRRRVTELGASGGSVVVLELEPELGAVRASVGYPTFDPNRIREPGYRAEQNRRYGDDSAWELDRPLLHALPPGSVFKIVTAAAALQVGLEHDGERPTAETKFMCMGEYRVGTRVLRCHTRAGHGSVATFDLVDGLKYSCNSCFYQLAHRHLTSAHLYAWGRAFGYGRHPGIDVPPHPSSTMGTGLFARGVLIDPDVARRRFTEASVCAYAIGQELVSATPLQVVRSAAAVALRGTRLPVPWLVTPAAPEPLPRLSETTIEVLGRGMKSAAEAGGTAGKLEYGLRRYSIAAKTGTAQYTSREERWHAWICGYAPLIRPRFAFVVVVEKAPVGGGEGTAPVLAAVLEHLSVECPELLGVGP
jgi:penicillin-binding protein 2